MADRLGHPTAGKGLERAGAPHIQRTKKGVGNHRCSLHDDLLCWRAALESCHLLPSEVPCLTLDINGKKFETDAEPRRFCGYCAITLA